MEPYFYIMFFFLVLPPIPRAAIKVFVLAPVVDVGAVLEHDGSARARSPLSAFSQMAAPIVKHFASEQPSALAD